jgi:hypothetical protein
MYDCSHRLVEDSGKRAKVDYQLEDFKTRKGTFGNEFATYQHISGNLMEVDILNCNGSLCEYLV